VNLTDEKKSLDDIVYEKLKKAIILNKFPPNYKLVESEIAESLNVSRTPVHTALKILEKDGLLMIIPNRGAFVTKKKYHEIREAFVVRLVLEKMAARLAANNITEDDIEELREILEKEKQAFAEMNRSDAYFIGGEFHKKIVEIAGNSCLAKYVEDVIIETNIYDVFYLLNDPLSDHEFFTIRQHNEIFEALVQNDAELAEKLMGEHILTLESQLNLVCHDEVDNLSILLNDTL
jgi:DNA-binding GntR family transcriptional regulator